ncbi:hypothetical protein BDV93DRAFT_511019 [Ceratobasidium sp. AG-I]|nr:hypothetical protein BDV93DRAFT_511019 [Ceratobasidium sp. AG-I]
MSCQEDYLGANREDIATPLTEEQKGDLYAELASGAESGWDYTSRPASHSQETQPTPPQTLHLQTPRTNPTSYHKTAKHLRVAVLDLCRKEKKTTSCDFNTTSGEQIRIFPTAAFTYIGWGLPLIVLPTELPEHEQSSSTGMLQKTSTPERTRHSVQWRCGEDERKVEGLSSPRNATNSDSTSEGYMFENFSVLDVGQARSSGEYTVQDGFGWTNGVVIWIGAKYGAILANHPARRLSLIIRRMQTGRSCLLDARDRFGSGNEGGGTMNEDSGDGTKVVCMV